MSVTVSQPYHDSKEEAGLLKRVRRRRGIFALIFVVVSGAVALVYMALPATYLAAGAVMVTGSPLQMGGDISPAAEQKLGDPADMDTQIIIAKSPRLINDMLRDPKVVQLVNQDCEAAQKGSPINQIRMMLKWPPKSCETQLAGGQMLTWLQDRFSVGSAGRSRVIQIAYQSQSAVIAASLVNSLTNAFIAQQAADKQRSRVDAAAWVHAELARIGADLHNSELEIENFRRNHGLVRGQTASIASERLTQVTQQLASAEAAWSDAGAQLAQLSSGADSARQTLDSRSVSDLKQQLATVSSEQARMTAAYGRSYPGIEALDKQRAELQRRIGEETGRVRASLEHDYASASAQVASLRKQMDEIKQSVGVGDLAETQIASMVRDNDVKRELYTDLSKKANDIEAQRRLLSGDVQLVSYAETPDKKSSPKLLLFVMAGLVLSTGLASAAALVRDRSDGAVRTTGRLEALSTVSVLGYIPNVGRLGSAYTRGAGKHIARPSALQEAVRSLYTKSILLGMPKRPRTVLLTSAQPGEGKSFLTLAMAHFGAAAGQRILVVEADLRRPGFRKALGLSNGPGLVDILRAKVGPGEAVHETDFGFDVVMAGAATVASTELLSNGRIAAFLEWCTARYDLVLIDSPPAQVLMDAHVLAHQVDAVLHCARWGHSSVATVADSVRNLRQAGGQVTGLAIGMVNPSEYSLYDPVQLPRGAYLMAPG